MRDQATEQAFNENLLGLLRDLNYVVMAVTIDKLEHKEKYRMWRFDPYHYCLSMLTERYTRWLSRRNQVGDVMAESRGGKEDRRLKKSFSLLFESGTAYMNPSDFNQILTSCQLKVKPKQNNIAGLQIADLIAHPVYKTMIARRENKPDPTTFGSQIFEIIERTKFDRSPSGRIDGWGMKWLP